METGRRLLHLGRRKVVAGGVAHFPIGVMSPASDRRRGGCCCCRWQWRRPDRGGADERLFSSLPRVACIHRHLFAAPAGGGHPGSSAKPPHFDSLSLLALAGAQSCATVSRTRPNQIPSSAPKRSKTRKQQQQRRGLLPIRAEDPRIEVELGATVRLSNKLHLADERSQPPATVRV